MERDQRYAKAMRERAADEGSRRVRGSPWWSAEPRAKKTMKARAGTTTFSDFYYWL